MKDIKRKRFLIVSIIYYIESILTAIVAMYTGKLGASFFAFFASFILAYGITSLIETEYQITFKKSVILYYTIKILSYIICFYFYEIMLKKG